MRGESPELVQAEDWSQPASFTGSTTPIFLIHDGGGTTFAYHCLNPLYRFVYGIPNPYFFCGSRFAGGLAEMGRLYAQRIHAAVSQPDFPAKRNADGSVDILLGGWSLGGLLSLEVAHLLAHDCAVRVVGILMVDSVCPGRPSNFHGAFVPPDISDEGKTKNQILSQRCMAEARRMVGEWDVPTWQGRYASKRPRMVLVRATDYIPTQDSSISSLDINRKDAILGWGRHDEAMFEHVVDVEGHHFDIFAMHRIESTTAAIRRGLDTLEAAVYPRGLRGGARKMLHKS
ncbi:insecticidal toxin complex protein [Hirsutella rhossiliensis]|uniref:Insecticidal toxin complex protein n=1 Tax=Hirsutella rhossiliensis TaxID=111463 RepID=A0A9P8SL22_9HYPO|nr:insecticidal toxin complex protein [Hirsutella rhossiliensis]KAH0964686.1 insecticidal toxin complex protein [Hirsutella rhossiliensis]